MSISASKLEFPLFLQQALIPLLQALFEVMPLNLASREVFAQLANGRLYPVFRGPATEELRVCLRTRLEIQLSRRCFFG